MARQSLSDSKASVLTVLTLHHKQLCADIFLQTFSFKDMHILHPGRKDQRKQILVVYSRFIASTAKNFSSRIKILYFGFIITPPNLHLLRQAFCPQSPHLESLKSLRKQSHWYYNHTWAMVNEKRDQRQIPAVYLHLLYFISILDSSFQSDKWPQHTWLYARMYELMNKWQQHNAINKVGIKIWIEYTFNGFQ